MSEHKPKILAVGPAERPRLYAAACSCGFHLGLYRERRWAVADHAWHVLQNEDTP